MVNYRLKAAILEIADNQLKINDPAIVKETFGSQRNLVSS
jgi:hypothetical protein